MATKIDVAEAVVRFVGDQTGLAADLVGVQRDTEASLGGLSRTIRRFNPFNALAAAATAAVGGIAAITIASSKFQDQIAKTSRQIGGISVPALSELRFAAEFAGVETNVLDAALSALSRRIAKADGGIQEMKASFDRLGISLRDDNGQLKDTEVVLREVSDAFQNLADGPTKARIAMDIMSDSGQKLIPLLNLGSAGLDEMRRKAEDFGLSVSGEAAAASEQLNDNVVDLFNTLQGFGLSLANELIPTLRDLTGGMSEWLRINSGIIRQGFGEVGIEIAGGVKAVADALVDLNSTGVLTAESIANAFGLIRKTIEGVKLGALALNVAMLDISVGVVERFEKMWFNVRQLTGVAFQGVKLIILGALSEAVRLSSAEFERLFGALPLGALGEKIRTAFADSQSGIREVMAAINEETQKILDTEFEGSNLLEGLKSVQQEVGADLEAAIEESAGRFADLEIAASETVDALDDTFKGAADLRVGLTQAELDAQTAVMAKIREFSEQSVQDRIEREQLRIIREREILEAEAEQKIQDAILLQEALLQIQGAATERMSQLLAIQAANERDKTEKVIAFAKEERDAKLLAAASYTSGIATMLGGLAELSGRENKKEFERTKKLRILQTIIAGAAAIIQAWVNPSWPGALALTVGIVAQTAASVKQIRKQTFSPRAQGGADNIPEDQTLLAHRGEIVAPRKPADQIRTFGASLPPLTVALRNMVRLLDRQARNEERAATLGPGSAAAAGQRAATAGPLAGEQRETIIRVVPAEGADESLAEAIGGNETILRALLRGIRFEVEQGSFPLAATDLTGTAGVA